MRSRRVGLLVVLIAATAVPARSQEFERTSAETVVSTQAQSSWDEPTLMVDALTTIRLGSGASALVRPWAWRRPDGTWTAAWYQMQVRYQRQARGFAWRADAGIITSPIGLGAAQLRADQNPLLSPPFYYVVPLPRFDVRFDGLQMMSGGYPLGAVVTASRSWWDVRGGVTDATPARAQSELTRGRAPAHAQVVFGAGVSPIAGLRIGGAFARGRYRADTGSALIPHIEAADATVLNLEAEYAVRYTRVSGEWVRNAFDTTTRPVHATAFYAQAVQTLTPRWFAAGRFTRVATVVLGASLVPQSQHVAETSIGYRVTPEWTVRGGYALQRSYAGVRSQQAGVSVVWARRW